MRCETSDLEIETIYNRIKNKDVNLQPDFQRGEVWSSQKKKKLIDSILRGWKIPPIHLVQGDNAIDEVLDGQQRLVSIRDFIDNSIEIDGNIAPLDEKIQHYHGMLYKDLPIQEQRAFRKYIIIVIRLSEFKPEEPAELFYRLNQPVSLTSAEQRNAFIGKTRDQVKSLVSLFTKLGANKDTIGFSNSRLAYDEVISKFCHTVELKTLKRKITAAEISDKYRNDISFSTESFSITQTVIRRFIEAIKMNETQEGYRLMFNKATLFSWFVFIKSNPNESAKEISEVISRFEMCRNYLKGKNKNGLMLNFEYWFSTLQSRYPFLEIMINTFNQRASMGSTDALSIIYRDIILHIFNDIIYFPQSSLPEIVINSFYEKQNLSFALERIYNELDWGENF